MLQNQFRALLGLLAVVVLASTASANVLVNPGFEDPAFVGAEQAGAGSGWTPFGGVFRIQGQPPIGPAGAHGGDVVLKVFGVAGVFQDFAASEGDVWSGSAWALNDSADQMAGGQIAAVNIEWLDGTGTNIGTEFGGTIDASTAADVWTLLTASGVAPAGTAFARLVLITGDFAPGGAGGAPRFDDASFERVIPIPGAVLLLGSGLFGLLGFRRKKAA